MVRSRESGRPMMTALSAVAAPLLGVLAALVLTGELAPLPGLIALAVGVAALVLPLRGHYGELLALSAYLRTLARGGAAEPPALSHPGTPIELAGALRQLRDAWTRHQVDAAGSANQTLLDSLPDPLITIDNGRCVVRTNPAADRLLGRGLAGQDLALVLRSPMVLETADAVLAGGVPAQVEFAFPVPIERDFSAHIARLPATAADGAAALIALHDLTAIKRTEQLRADFVANASHELRTPLAVLSSCIDTLQGAARGDEAAEERFLGTMRRQASRMARLVDDLLSLSRIELDEHTPPSDLVDLSQVMRRVAEAMEMEAKANDVTLVLAPIDDLPKIVGDGDQLTQVFQNLIDNAIKYGGRHSTVRIAARLIEHDLPVEAPPGMTRAVAVAVTDQGDGIAEEHLPRLTERFYRVDTARSRELGGTGLGLAIVKHILSRHRGVLAIDSTIGQGSTFTVLLPVG